MAASGRNLPNLRQLALPARDLARGLRHGLARARGLAPLPGPLRDIAGGMISNVEGLAGTARAAVSRLRPGARTPHSLSEIAGGHDPALHFAAAAAYGLGLALRRMGRDDLLVSETVAAVAYRGSAAGSASEAGMPEIAARLALALSQHHAAGVMPGTPIGLGATDARQLLLAAYAVMLWMTIERDAAREDEDGLLALCVDLTVSLGDEIAAASAAPDRLAALIAAHAEMV